MERPGASTLGRSAASSRRRSPRAAPMRQHPRKCTTPRMRGHPSARNPSSKRPARRDPRRPRRRAARLPERFDFRTAARPRTWPVGRSRHEARAGNSVRPSAPHGGRPAAPVRGQPRCRASESPGHQVACVAGAPSGWPSADADGRAAEPDASPAESDLVVAVGPQEFVHDPRSRFLAFAPGSRSTSPPHISRCSTASDRQDPQRAGQRVHHAGAVHRLCPARHQPHPRSLPV